MTTHAPRPVPAGSAPSIRPDEAADARTEVARAPRQRNHRRRQQIGRIVNRAVLVLLGLVFMYPFAWLVAASFKPRGEVFDNRLIPQTFTPQNYIDVWAEAPLAVWLMNTVIVTALAAVTVAMSSAMVAWGFAYFRFKGRGVLFGFVLATMMLPGAVTMIPTFLIWNALGMTGTLVPLWAGNLFGSAFYVFLLRQFFLGLPREVFEAARIDGAGNFRLFWSIALPLAKPAFIIALLFEAQAAWTDLMTPLIYLRDSDTFTIPRGLKALVDQFGFGGNWNWEIIITASVITTLPMIILFFVGQRYFVDGIATTGMKG